MKKDKLHRCLSLFEDIEVGFFDNEGHWFEIKEIEYTYVDDLDWHPIGEEKVTRKLRKVIELK